MIRYEKTHRYIRNDYQFFDTLKTKDCKIRGNCNLLIKVKFHELEWSSPLKSFFSCSHVQEFIAIYFALYERHDISAEALKLIIKVAENDIK